jgi:hypothetical protein
VKKKRRPKKEMTVTDQENLPKAKDYQMAAALQPPFPIPGTSKSFAATRIENEFRFLVHVYRNTITARHDGRTCCCHIIIQNTHSRVGSRNLGVEWSEMRKIIAYHVG